MRCCYRPSLAAAATALLLACASSTVTTVAGDRVLVVGAQKDLVHDAIAADSNPSSLATTFTPAGLAGLAMDALGLATGNLVRLSSGGGDSAEIASQIAVSSPAQADVFSRVDAYAVVLVDRADAAVVDGVDAAVTAGYHKVFELQEHAASAKIPKVIATELSKNAPTAEIKCAGDDAVCGSSLFKTVTVSEADVDRVFKAYSFLDRTVESDVVLAEQLAQTAQVTSGINSSTKKKSLVVVSFSGVNALDEGKREAARGAVRDHIQRLLAALQTAYPTSSGAQVVAAKHGAVRALDVTIAYSRMLLSFKEGVVGSDDDDDDDDSGSSEGAGNATTSDVTMQDIAEYQIVLWTSVLLGGVLLLVILAMCNMEPKRDSLLYAKFTTSNGGRKFD